MVIKFAPYEVEHLNALRSMCEIKERALVEMRNIYAGYLGVLLKTHQVDGLPVTLLQDGSGIDLQVPAKEA